MRRVAPWDVRLAARTLALSLVALGVVALVEWITDERGVASPGTGGRSIGVVPLVPLAGAIAVAIALAPARSSGELRALSALGASPWRLRAPATLAAMALAALAAIVIASGRVDVSPLFPSRVPASDWRVESTPSGPAFVSARRNARVGPDDVLARAATQSGSEQATADLGRRKNAAALAVFAAGAALSLWVGSPSRRRPLRTIVMLAIYGAAQVATFQSVGAGALPPRATALPPLLLFLTALFELRAERALAQEETWL